MLEVLRHLGHLIQMGGITRYLTRRTGATPVVHQALGGDAQITTQRLVTAQIQRFVQKHALQLPVQLAVQLLA
ncbi:hypothetical protein D9M71_796640 [compost metagenome]